MFLICPLSSSFSFVRKSCQHTKQFLMPCWVPITWWRKPIPHDLLRSVKPLGDILCITFASCDTQHHSQDCYHYPCSQLPPPDLQSLPHYTRRSSLSRSSTYSPQCLDLEGKSSSWFAVAFPYILPDTGIVFLLPPYQYSLISLTVGFYYFKHDSITPLARILKSLFSLGS